jgi:hypothetical protein
MIKIIEGLVNKLRAVPYPITIRYSTIINLMVVTFFFLLMDCYIINTKVRNKKKDIKI